VKGNPEPAPPRMTAPIFTMSPTPSTPSARSVRILYIETWEFMRVATAEYLQQQGYSVESVSDGLEGWKKFAEGDFDLIITDLDMVSFEGFTFIGRVRDSGRPVRIIVHSSAFTTPALAELRRLSVDACVPKASYPDALRDRIEHVMRVPR
jgi:DNA-binding response OmpR family regulator